MPLMLSKLYDALIEAGASELKAREAAEESAAFETRFNRIEADLTTIMSEVRLLRWVMTLGFGILITVTVAMLGALWNIMQRLPSAS